MPWLALACVFFGLFFFVFFSHAQQTDDVLPATEDMNADRGPIADKPVVPVSLPDVVDSVRVYPTDGRAEYTLYAYDTHELAQASYKEIMSERRADRQVFAVSNDMREVRIYAGAQYTYVSGGEWNYVAYATSSQWIVPERSRPVSLLGRIFPVAYAAEDYLVGAGDGMVQGRSNVSWAEARNAATGHTTYPANSELTIARGGEYSGGYYYIHRGYLPFNTNGLSGTISGATLNIYNVARSGSTASVCLVETSQGDPTTLAVADYSALTLNSPTEGATRLPLSGISDNAYFSMSLNTSGLSWIDTAGYTLLGLRISNDVDNTGQPASDQSIYVRLSEYAGTDYDPYLAISISSSTPVATSSEYFGVNMIIYFFSIFSLLCTMIFLCIYLGYQLALALVS